MYELSLEMLGWVINLFLFKKKNPAALEADADADEASLYCPSDSYLEMFRI